MIPNPGPACRQQNDHANFPARQVLLMAKILVSGYEGVEAVRFRAFQKVSVLKIAPPSFVGRLDDVISEVIP
jgi:hypothetical protein